MTERTLFFIDNKIWKAFRSTRLQGHGRKINQHKQAKIFIFRKRFAYSG